MSDGDFIPENPPAEERQSLFEAAAREGHRHKWIESEKACRDLGYEAIRDWHKKYWRTFCRECHMEHLRGATYWSELDNNDFGLLNYKFHDNTELVDAIVERLTQGGENLDVIQWAVAEGIDSTEVIEVLQILDINSRRLAPAVFMDEETFVANIKASHHARALIVDDDRDTREIMETLIREEGMDSVAVASGEEALVEVQSRRFDLFLIDIMLPGKHGAEVAWYLHRHGVRAPVVAVSAALELWSEDDLLDCGFSDLMPKPFDMNRLRDLCRKVITEIDKE